MTIKTRGIIIRKMDLGEADRIFTVLTQDRGKIRVVAKGVRRGTSKLAGYLDLLRCNDFELAEGRNLDIVTGAMSVANFGEDMTDLNSFGIRLYLCEVIEKTVEEEAPVQGIYELLSESLSAIQQKTMPSLLAKSYFEMKLLSLFGIHPQIQTSVISGRSLDPNGPIYFSARLGGIVGEGEAEDDQSLISTSANVVKVMRTLAAWSIGEVAKLKTPIGVIQEVEYIVSEYATYALEIRSKSLKVMSELEG